jgi:hypothetical protein
MLQWTSAGAVATPRTIQIRVQRSHPDRVQAGAPEPVRSLSPSELEQNLRFFTEGMRGPRSVSCTRLVLSGVSVARRPDLGRAINLARSLGIEKIIVHTSADDLLAGAETLQGVDRLVLAVPTRAAARAHLGSTLIPGQVPWSALIRMHHHPEPTKEQLLLDTLKLGPSELVLSSPFPLRLDTLPPDPTQIEEWLGACERALTADGLPWRIQGLPGCYLGPHSQRIRRASNRWYVDSEHQLSNALRFFPDVTRFHKDDGCRFCSMDSSCDGFFAQWAGRHGLPPLVPMD